MENRNEPPRPYPPYPPQYPYPPDMSKGGEEGRTDPFQGVRQQAPPSGGWQAPPVQTPPQWQVPPVEQAPPPGWQAPPARPVPPPDWQQNCPPVPPQGAYYPPPYPPQSGPYPYPPRYPYPPVSPPVQKKTTGAAVISFVFGLLAILCSGFFIELVCSGPRFFLGGFLELGFAITALVLGIRERKKSGLAVAGLVLGGIALTIPLVYLFFFYLILFVMAIY